MRNYSVSQIFFKNILSWNKIHEAGRFEYRCTKTANTYTVINQFSKNAFKLMTSSTPLFVGRQLPKSVIG